MDPDRDPAGMQLNEVGQASGKNDWGKKKRAGIATNCIEIRYLQRSWDNTRNRDLVQIV